MSLKETLSADIITSLKAGDSARTGVLRFLMAQVKNREIEKRSKSGTDVLTDEEVREVIAREAKKRNEAIELYTKGNRADLADAEKAELVILKTYLPAQYSRDEIKAVISKLKDSGMNDFPTLIKASMAELKGKADGKLVTEVIKEVLGG